MKPIFVILLAFLCVNLLAQWSMDAAAPTLIAGGAGDQSLPKVAITADNNVYISRFDNSTGSYKAMLNYFSPTGANHWIDPLGIQLPGNVNDSWLTDYDMTADQDGNAIICLQDVRNGVNNVYVYKVLASGQQAWGQNGLALSADTNPDNANYTPTILNATDNTTWVAWQHSADSAPIEIQRIDSAGNPLWVYPAMLTTLNADNTWPQLVEGQDASVWIKYYADSGPFWAPNRHLKVVKYTAQGDFVSVYTISDVGGITAWTQIIGFEPDGLGGACFAWHDDRDGNQINEVYFAHINANGTISTPEDGALITAPSGMQQYYPKLVCDGDSQRAFIFFKTTDADQNQSGIVAQIMDYSGNRLLGDNGLTLNQLTAFSTNSLFAYLNGDQIGFVYSIGATPSSDQDLQIRLWEGSASSPTAPWLDRAIATNSSAKFHYDFGFHPSGWIMSTWEDGNSAYDIYAMRVNPDGLGSPYNAPSNLQAYYIPPDTIHLSWDVPSFIVPDYYEIYFNNQAVNTVPGSLNEVELNPIPPGTYDIYMIAMYDDTIASPPSQTVSVTVVSNDDPLVPSTRESLVIYPNPSSVSSTIKWYSKEASSGRISLYNIRGQQVYTKQLSAVSGWQEQELELLDYPAGIYLLKLDNGSGVLSRRLLITRK